MKLKTVKSIFLFGFITTILLACFAASRDSVPMLLVVIILCFGLVAFQIIFYRCPHCGRYIGRNDGDFCQYCGKPLDED